jgi:putative flavoprotein involved in K+ transport
MPDDQLPCAEEPMMREPSGREDAAGCTGPVERLDTVIIGGGQAGLAVGYCLAQLGLPFAILDDHERAGDSWRERYDSLRLFSPAKYDALPGMRFPASGYTFPSGQQMADYLEDYARQMRLLIRAGIRVDALRPADEGGYLVTAGQRRFAAAQVVVATGAQQLPFVPAFAGQLDPGIRQLHSSEYRGPAQLLDGDVLVVGAGHSGADIALDAASGHKTWLSGTVHGQVPFDVEGRLARPIWTLLWFVADHVLTVRTPLGRKMKPAARGPGGPLVRVKLPELTAAGVEHVDARTTGVRDGRPELGDGRVLDVANVIWCTGFQQDFGWVHLPVTDEHGWPRHDRGVVGSAPGLYFVGLPMQYAYTSHLVGGAGRDAEHVARHIAARQARRARHVHESQSSRV